MSYNGRKKKGLTLIEVIVSIAILGIISVAFLSIFGMGFKTVMTAKNTSVAGFNVQKLAESELNIKLDPDDNSTIDIKLNDNTIIQPHGKIFSKTATVNNSNVVIQIFVPRQ